MMMRQIGLHLLVVLAVVLVTSGQTIKPIPGAITLYADGFASTPTTFSLVFDTAKFKLAGDPKTDPRVIQFFVKESYLPEPGKANEAWIACTVSDKEGAANCGAGKTNVFFSKEDSVAPWGQQIGTKWITTVRAQAPGMGEAWRARVAVQVFPIK